MKIEHRTEIPLDSSKIENTDESVGGPSGFEQTARTASASTEAADAQSTDDRHTNHSECMEALELELAEKTMNQETSYKDMQKQNRLQAKLDRQIEKLEMKMSEM